MKRATAVAASASLALAAVPASSVIADSKASIHIVSYNQYAGASLFGGDVEAILETYARNFTPLRLDRQARLIARRKPHVVALQEVLDIECRTMPTLSGVGADALPPICSTDFLATTMDSLADAGVDYRPVSRNRYAPLSFTVGVSVDGGDLRASVAVRASDVLLVRSDVDAVNHEFACADGQGSVAIPDDDPELDGCPYVNLIESPLGPVERGFHGVDLDVDGRDFLVVNTHLEARYPSSPIGYLNQTQQAVELLAALDTSDEVDGVRDSGIVRDVDDEVQVVIVGDMNSDPGDPGQSYSWSSDLSGMTPYKVLLGSGEYVDAWTLRPGRPDGFTCCQQEDLRNDPSELSRRIDHAWLKTGTRHPTTTRVKMNLIGDASDDRVAVPPDAQPIWPSDHAGIGVRVFLDGASRGERPGRGR